MTAGQHGRHWMLSIDFDGVLHPHDAHFELADVSTMTAEQLRQAGLFKHCELLAEILEAYPQVDLVVHSSWRKRRDLEALRELLGPLGPRLRAVTPPELDREESIIDLMRRRRIPTSRVVVLDDQPELFARLRDRVVVCEATDGLLSAVYALRLVLPPRPAVSADEVRFPGLAWMSSVDELVDGVLELVSEAGELNLHTASLDLLDLRRLAERVKVA